MPPIVFTVDAKEATLILNALARLPYADVNALIGKLHTAVTTQLAAQGTNNGSHKSE